MKFFRRSFGKRDRYLDPRSGPSSTTVGLALGSSACPVRWSASGCFGSSAAAAIDRCERRASSSPGTCPGSLGWRRERCLETTGLESELEIEIECGLESEFGKTLRQSPLKHLHNLLILLQQFVRELAYDLQERYVRWRTQWIVRILDGIEREVYALPMEGRDRLSVLLMIQAERQREALGQILQLTKAGVLLGVRVRIVVGARS